MNDLASIVEKIELTNEAMGRLTQMLRDEPEAPGLISNMNTLKLTHFQLEKEFDEAAKATGIEVCSYRLFPEGTNRQSIVGIGKALLNFQSLFSKIYAAIRIDSSQDENETILDFAYTFPGSVGVALTIPTQVNLFGNYFPETINVLSQLAKSRSTTELKAFSQRIGLAPIKALYTWADDLVNAGFGVEVKWKGISNEYPSLFIQKPELTSLKNVMRSTSDEHKKEFTKTGTLQGADMTNHSFHFQYKDPKGKMQDINGKFIDAITPAKPVKVPGKYTVSIKTTSRIFYSTDEEETKHLLLRVRKV